MSAAGGRARLPRLPRGAQPNKGEAAVKAILAKAPMAKVELLTVDVGSDESVAAAARALAGQSLFALVRGCVPPAAAACSAAIHRCGGEGAGRAIAF